MFSNKAWAFRDSLMSRMSIESIRNSAALLTGSLLGALGADAERRGPPGECPLTTVGRNGGALRRRGELRIMLIFGALALWAWRL